MFKYLHSVWHSIFSIESIDDSRVFMRIMREIIGYKHSPQSKCHHEFFHLKVTKRGSFCYIMSIMSKGVQTFQLWHRHDISGNKRFISGVRKEGTRKIHPNKWKSV